VTGAACATNDTGGAVGTGPTTSGAPVDAALVIDVTGASNGPRSGSITCRGGGGSGTGIYLAAPVATAACAAVLADPEAKRRLTEGRQKEVACTQQYGGPATAHVTGTFAGAPVDTTFDRKDGCGIGDWDHLVALLGAP
jgi:hypothetical protein